MEQSPAAARLVLAPKLNVLCVTRTPDDALVRVSIGTTILADLDCKTIQICASPDPVYELPDNATEAGIDRLVNLFSALSNRMYEKSRNGGKIAYTFV